FLGCINYFTIREVKPEKATRSDHCLQNYLKTTQRITMRFQENKPLAAKVGLLVQLF
ncbi:TIM9 translocase, partial [Tricholaema leucomelas]|nr:TIM9 translocase [Tricholaema leucomelas]